MTDVELALERRLDEELNQLQPRPVPSEAVYGRARAIRRKRRVWAAGAVATATVLGASVPVLGPTRLGLGHSAAGSGNSVTVNAPRTDTKGRSVFSGSEDGKRWSVAVAPGGCPSGGFAAACNGQPGDDPAEFSYFASTGSPTTYAVFFRSDVARIDVALSDGEQVTLLPGTVRGNRVGLVVIPPKIAITRLDTYTADGSLVAYSIPFQTDGVAHFAMWYRPGESAAQPEASGTITGTTPKGTKASVGVRIGPFGICYTVAQRPTSGATPITNCLPLTTQESDDVPPRNFDWVALGGRVDGRADHTDFKMSTGTIRVPVVYIGMYAFTVCFEDYGFTTVGRTTYDTFGNVLSYTQTPTKS